MSRDDARLMNALSGLARAEREQLPSCLAGVVRVQGAVDALSSQLEAIHGGFLQPLVSLHTCYLLEQEQVQQALMVFARQLAQASHWLDRAERLNEDILGKIATALIASDDMLGLLQGGEAAYSRATSSLLAHATRQGGAVASDARLLLEILRYQQMCLSALSLKVARMQLAIRHLQSGRLPLRHLQALLEAG